MTFAPRIGVIGAGKRARVHLGALYRIRERNYLFTDNRLDQPESRYTRHAGRQPDWLTPTDDLRPEVTALCDPNEAERGLTETTCTDHGDDPEEFDSLVQFHTDADVDAVLVTSPNDTHMEAVPPLLEDGVDVFCEKPLATTLEDHDRITEAATAAEGLFYPAYNLRMSPFYRRLKRLLDEGWLGDLGMISCYEIRKPFANGYRYSQERSGGALLEKNCHDFDLMCWYADADPVRVFAMGGQQVFETDSDVLDQATVVVAFDNGVLGSLDLCLYAPWGQRGRTYELRGSDGLLRSPEEGLTFDLYTHEGHERHSVDAQSSHAGADDRQFHRFLRCLDGTEEPPGTIREAKRAAAIALAAERAVRTGDPVEIGSDYTLR